mgnify:CR=1 FL=1
MKKAIVVFASGTGSNFKNIVEKIKIHNLDAEVVLLVSNNSNCNAVTFAKKNNIKTFIYNSKKYPNDFNQDILLKKIKQYEIDLIILAGYMKKISKNLIKNYKNKILNIHPSLLPKYGGKGFYGIKVHEQVINAKEKHSGATVHFVDEIYDNGPIIAQHRVHVSNDETAESLSRKVLEIEHKLFPYVVKKICENKVKFIKGKPLIQEY